MRTLILNARLNPEAKNPPKGATKDANTAITTACHIIFDTRMSREEGRKEGTPDGNCAGRG